ncbi:hypothetical protein ACIRRA_38395 [Nocardia sp. NPDC101769]|uniref:hypothetical protein n=1 Tax=Nocardia sp. NPDC101769 TaxID=3364333 RepID=UPI0038138F5F
MRKFAKVVAWISALLSIFGAYLWMRHSSAVPECNHHAMSPGEICRRIGGGGGEWTYEQEKQSIANSLPIDQALTIVAAAVFLVAIIGLQIAKSTSTTAANRP